MLEALITEFEAIEDPRDPCKVEHRLVDILVIAVCAVIAAAESFEDMADYGRCKEAELRSMLVDEVQAAACSSAACTGSPSRKRTPSISWPRRSEPSRQRQRRSADLASLKTIASAVWRDRQPLVLSVRSRTVAKVLSMGFVVRTCFQCSAGKS